VAQGEAPEVEEESLRSLEEEEEGVHLRNAHLRNASERMTRTIAFEEIFSVKW
jgi:hypothetical protein